MYPQLQRGGTGWWGNREEAGATAVEYTIMASLVAAIIVLAVVLVGQRTKSNFCDTNQALDAGGVRTHETTSLDCT